MTYHPGDRVKWRCRTPDTRIGPNKKPQGIRFTGEIIREGVTAQTWWVQWDQLPKGLHRPVQEDMIVPESASARILDIDP